MTKNITNKYSKEELEIIDYVENQKHKKLKNLQSEKDRYKKIFTENITRRKAISLRILENDLSKIKAKALIEGMPYQTLIGSILHKYANGNLISK